MSLASAIGHSSIGKFLGIFQISAGIADYEQKNGVGSYIKDCRKYNLVLEKLFRKEEKGDNFLKGYSDIPSFSTAEGKKLFVEGKAHLKELKNEKIAKIVEATLQKLQAKSGA